MALPPGLEVPGEHRQQPGFRARTFVRGGADEEAGAKLGVPADAVAAAHLVFEESGKQQALRPRRLHQRRVGRHCRVGHEVIEHGAEVGRRGHLGAGMCGGLRIVRKDAGVVDQLLPVNGSVRDVLQANEEKLQSTLAVDRQQFPERLHGPSL
jgi:hypothetical protein